VFLWATNDQACANQGVGVVRFVVGVGVFKQWRDGVVVSGHPERAFHGAVWRNDDGALGVCVSKAGVVADKRRRGRQAMGVAFVSG